MQRRKCYPITEVPEFPLCAEGKCYRSVITSPSMCDLQALKCVCFLREASVFQYSISVNRQDVFWSEWRGGREEEMRDRVEGDSLFPPLPLSPPSLSFSPPLSPSLLLLFCACSGMLGDGTETPQAGPR